nr:resuscitation-promoting factor RpfA-like [Aegilops tauschii subsp. strangulata]
MPSPWAPSPGPLTPAPVPGATPTPHLVARWTAPPRLSIAVRRGNPSPPLELFYHNPLTGSAPPVNLLLVVLSVDGLVLVLRPEQRCPSPYDPSEPLPLLLTLPHRVVPAPVRALARPCCRAPALALALVRPYYSPLPASPACSPRAGAPAYGRGLPPPP